MDGKSNINFRPGDGRPVDDSIKYEAVVGCKLRTSRMRGKCVIPKSITPPTGFCLFGLFYFAYQADQLIRAANWSELCVLCLPRNQRTTSLSTRGHIDPTQHI